MRPTNDELLMFMKGVYEQTGGKLNEDVSMWEVGESLGWERTRTTAVYERLADKRLIEAFAMGGTIVLPLRGLEFCEETFGASEGRPENRIRLLKATYHETEGSRRNIADIFSVGESLGLDRDETTQAYHYLSKKHLFEGRGIGGMTSLTQYGLDFVEQELLKIENFEEATAPDEEATPGGIADTGERRFAFFSIDIVGHSRFVTSPDFQRSEVSRTLDAFKQLVDEEANKRFCLANNWAGDGGLYFFRGDGCQGRTYGGARAILRRLPEFNNTDNVIGQLLQVRIAAHTDFFKMPDDIAKIHDASLILVNELQEDADPNTIVVTNKLYKDLDQQQKQELEQLPNHEGGFALYCYRLPEEDQ